MEQERTGARRHLKRVMDSKWTLWGVALLALFLLCVSATVAFGFGFFREAPAKPLQHVPSVSDNSPTLLKVVGTDDGDVANMGGNVPSTAAAAALQSQNPSTTPQSTTSQQNAVGTSLSAGAVNLQAGVSATVNALNVNELGL